MVIVVHIETNIIVLVNAFVVVLFDGVADVVVVDRGGDDICIDFVVDIVAVIVNVLVIVLVLILVDVFLLLVFFYLLFLVFFVSWYFSCSLIVFFVFYTPFNV